MIRDIVNRCYVFEALCNEYLHGDRKKLAQLFQNYDYVDSPSGPGTSPYMAMNNGETKSIPEWREKNKKRQKENEKKITDTRSDKFKPKKAGEQCGCTFEQCEHGKLNKSCSNLVTDPTMVFRGRTICMPCLATIQHELPKLP